ncbi:MAG: anti-sigma factor domain-containing protein [Propionibacteriaceae bacterium]
MTHVSAEHLAGHALDLSEELTRAELDHLTGCLECQHELTDLRRVVDLSRHEGTARAPLAPNADVWARICDELAADETSGWVVPPDPAAVVSPAPIAASEPTRQGWSRRGLVLLAAAVGLIVGVSGVLGIGRAFRTEPTANPGPPVEVIARTTLAPLPGKTGSGSAELVRDAAGTELRVQVDAAGTADDFHELWLINTDGKRMVSLGTLPPSGVGSYPVPPGLAQQLGAYRIVDVSIEPYDGNAAHSRNSLVRGTLPA